MSAWASSPSSATTRSLLDIMSEELAVKLQCPDEAHVETISESAIENTHIEYCDDVLDADLALAIALQEMEDSGYADGSVDTPSFNKISVSTSARHQFPTLPTGKAIQSSDRYAAEALGDMLKGECGQSIQFRNGVAVLPDGSLVSKHDSLIDGLYNAISLTEIDGVGDLDFAGLMVGNTVANDLKMYRQKKQKKGISTSGRVSAKDVSITTESVLDPATRMIIFKLIQGGRFDHLHGVIKTGKEANVYHAEKSQMEGEVLPPDGPSGEWGQTTQFAVKVFKTTLNEFSNRADYVDGDHRYYGKKFGKIPKRNAIIQVRRLSSLHIILLAEGIFWTEKEFRNLCRAHAAGLAVPQPLFHRDNVLVMSLVGDVKLISAQKSIEDGGDTSSTDALSISRIEPSPQLKEAASGIGDPTVWRGIYEQTIVLVHNLYHMCRLVHADLSEYNLLLRDGRDVFAIDFGQAVDISHPRHLDFLRRDLETVTAFFAKQFDHVLPVDVALSVVVTGPECDESIDITMQVRNALESVR